MIKLKDIYNEIQLTNKITFEMFYDLVNKKKFNDVYKICLNYGIEDSLGVSDWIESLPQNDFKALYIDISKLPNMVDMDEIRLKQENTTGSSATFTPGVGENYATPKAFGKKKKKKYKDSGYTEVNPKQRFKAKTFDISNWKSNKPKYLK